MIKWRLKLHLMTSSTIIIIKSALLFGRKQDIRQYGPAFFSHGYGLNKRNSWIHYSPWRDVLWDFYQVTRRCLSTVSCSLENDDSMPVKVILNERTANRVNQAGLIGNNDSVDTLEFLLALGQNNNSCEPAIWHALGCATSLSCHP